ncbi:hypothetical protein BC826DRAFT_693921 [Russula brevipes]|nr:hypothetical protein BC826DRAFT_693921 [Russula brevipes]
MSRTDDQDTERNVIVDGCLKQPPSAHSLQGETNFGDSSRSLFNLYSGIAGDEDREMADHWEENAQMVVVFTGIFSIVVAILLVVSIQDLRPNPQVTSAFYLENIYQLLADPNVSLPSSPSAVPRPPVFAPPNYALWVNTLWFLSLAINLTCAVSAMLSIQWASRYRSVTLRARGSPEQCARVRVMFANGAKASYIFWVIEAIPALVHFSLFIFFSGLLIYLFNINHTVSSALMSWVALSSAGYLCLTFVPIFRHNTPYFTPLSAITWALCNGMLFAVFRVLSTLRGPFSHQTRERFFCLMSQFRGRFQGGMRRAVEETASKLSSEIYIHVLESTIDTLNREDYSVEMFIDAVPGFYQSDVFKGIRQHLPREVHWKILNTLVRFLQRTLSSKLSDRAIYRLTICLRAASELDNSLGDVDGVRFIFDGIIHENWGGMPDPVGIGCFLRHWDQTSNGRYTPYIRGIIAQILAGTRVRDGHWAGLAVEHMDLTEPMYKDYMTHGDSMLLANLIHTTRQLSRSNSAPIDVLRSLSEFDVHSTLPGLQHDFCALWNETVQQVEDGGALSRAAQVLPHIRPIYNALHQSTDDEPSPYPLCDNPAHRPPPTPHIQVVTAEEAASPSHPAPAPQVLPPSPAVPLDSATTSSAPATADHPAISSTEASDSDRHSAPDAMTPIPQSAPQP